MKNTLFVASALLLALPMDAGSQAASNMTLLANKDDFAQYSACWGYNAPDGRVYALLGANTGTAIYNITDPRNPVFRGLIAGPTSSWREMKTYGPYVYVTTEGFISSPPSGLQIISMVDPENPLLVGVYNTTFNTAHTLYIDEASARAYINGSRDQTALQRHGGAISTGMRILDLSNPTAPQDLGAYTQVYIHDSYVRDNICWGAAIQDPTPSIRILDVSNPAAVQPLQTVFYPNAGTHNTALTEDSGYLATSDETHGFTMRIWDVRNLNNIQQVAEYHAGGAFSSSIVHNVHIRGPLAYVAHYTAGTRVLDIDDPTAPTEIGYYDTYSQDNSFNYRGNWDVWPFAQNGAIVSSDISNGLFVTAFTPSQRLMVTGTGVGGAATSVVRRLYRAGSQPGQMAFETAPPKGFGDPSPCSDSSSQLCVPSDPQGQ
jgi:choice-of-anchor B domain-containing protein